MSFDTRQFQGLIGQGPFHQYLHLILVSTVLFLGFDDLTLASAFLLLAS